LKAYELGSNGVLIPELDMNEHLGT
jgi:hypothetical protein